MLLKTNIRQILCLIMMVGLVVLSACSDNQDTATTTSPLASPARLAEIDSDTLLVSDYTENRFCTVDKASLDIVQCFSTKGQPTGIVYVDYNGGRFFVGNKSVGSVDIFDGLGNFLGHLGGTTNLFGRVNDLAVDTTNQLLYVLDSAGPVVKVFDFEGQDLRLDFGDSDLKSPTALTVVQSTGEILVSDFGDPSSFIDPCPQIKLFDSSRSVDGGRAIVGNMGGGGMFASCGAGQFSTPQGLSVDSGNNVFLVDALTGKVLMFNLDTSRDVPLKTLGSVGSELGELFYPLDVVVDETTKDVFVADYRNGRITVFTGGGALP